MLPAPHADLSRHTLIVKSAVDHHAKNTASCLSFQAKNPLSGKFAGCHFPGNQQAPTDVAAIARTLHIRRINA
jgi:hypothetical protein